MRTICLLNEVEAIQRLIESFDLPHMQKVMWAACGSAGIIKAVAAQNYHQIDILS